MKTIKFLSVLFVITLVFGFVACNKPCGCGGDYTVDNNPNICIKFKNTIGNDLDTALDSLKRWYEPQLDRLAIEGHYSGNGYYIEKEKINVDFTEDNRAFFLIYFIDSVSVYHTIIANNDVIDEKGNHYVYIITLKD